MGEGEAELRTDGRGAPTLHRCEPPTLERPGFMRALCFMNWPWPFAGLSLSLHVPVDTIGNRGKKL